MLIAIVDEIRSRIVLDPFSGRVTSREIATEQQLELQCRWEDLSHEANIDPRIGPLKAAGLRVSTVFPGMFLALTSSGVRVLNVNQAADYVRDAMRPHQGTQRHS